ncbi:MAG: glycine--tRNA ligase subunit beta [Thermoleophilia bacterium]|nr:glycine--tRNA ligase subunit beta [Thermoleophilia bacterium]
MPDDTITRNARTLLWEVGCEELPAWACVAIERQVGGLVLDAITESGLAVSGATPVVWVGPRRFSILLETLGERPAVNETLSGPPVKIAFEGGDPSAAPSKAGVGFARKAGVEVAELQVNSDTGVTFVERTVPSAAIEELWPALADQILGKLQFAKPMRWGTSPWRFVRPIRWMVTMHDERVISYDCWGVTSGRTTRTHRFLGDAREVQLATADLYATTLRDANVIVDHELRRTVIVQGLEAAAAELGGSWNDPGNVLREVVHLVEKPTVLTGRFDERYLELPERVLVTAMQSHQRYFPVATADGSLAPAFLTVMNAAPSATASILPGYERVLAGRLDDAVFSFERDRARGLDDMATDESLGAVVFHAKAGSLAERRDRITAVAKEIGRQLGLDARQVSDAARLAKADQVSGVVQEFADLEGFAGSLYAAANGYGDDVCRAIDQQFLPRGLDSQLPDAGVPAALALADKLELLVTMFAIGEQPTGSRDPHGLRRAAIGVARIVLEHDLAIDLQAALAAAGAAIDDQGHGTVDGELLGSVHDFVIDRVEKRLADDGVRVDAVRAARAADLPLLQHLDELARAIDVEVKGGEPHFEQIIEAQDRSRKLIDKAGGIADGAIDESAFENASERDLHQWLSGHASEVAVAIADRRFGDAVNAAASLGPLVDAFFSKEQGVMIMSDDDVVRTNRLRLLAGVIEATAPLGDLSQLQV